MTNEKLKKLFFLAIASGGLMLFGITYILLTYAPEYSNNFEKKAEGLLTQYITPNTVRVYGKDHYETAAAISQIVYPGTFGGNRPNAVILVRGDRKEEASAAAQLINYLVNAPILYIEKDNIPEVTWNEMNRLNPKGIYLDRNTDVLLIGDIKSDVRKRIEIRGWKYRQIRGKDVYELGRNIDNYLAVLRNDHSNAVMVAPIEAPEYSLIHASMNAHAKSSFFYVNSSEIPPDVSESLRRRFGKAYIYILGNERNIPHNIELELAKHGHLQRIPGSSDIFRLSAEFARYLDVGKISGWWIGKANRNFGWGITEPGHNFIFANPEDWQSTIAASLLSNKGKQGPMLFVKSKEVPDEIKNYLDSVKPGYTTPQEQVYNHGWIIGNLDNINAEVQAEIDSLLNYGGSEAK